MFPSILFLRMLGCILFYSSSTIASLTSSKSVVIEIKGDCNTIGPRLADEHGYRYVRQVRFARFRLRAERIDLFRLDFRWILWIGRRSIVSESSSTSTSHRRRRWSGGHSSQSSTCRLTTSISLSLIASASDPMGRESNSKEKTETGIFFQRSSVDIDVVFGRKSNPLVDKCWFSASRCVILKYQVCQTWMSPVPGRWVIRVAEVLWHFSTMVSNSIIRIYKRIMFVESCFLLETHAHFLSESSIRIRKPAQISTTTTTIRRLATNRPMRISQFVDARNQFESIEKSISKGMELDVLGKSPLR